MATQKQIEASRRNASKSTGPKSEAGKARSKLNSLKHGLLAKAVVLPQEDVLEFEGLVQALALELGPNGVLEEQLVGCIAANFWRLRRIYQIESEFFEIQRAVIEYLNAKDRLKVIEANSGEDAMMQRAVMGIHPDDPWHKSATDEVNKTQSKVQNMSTGLGAIFKNDADNSDALGKLARYETGNGQGGLIDWFHRRGVVLSIGARGPVGRRSGLSLDLASVHLADGPVR